MIYISVYYICLYPYIFVSDCVEGFDAHTVKGYVIHDLESSSQVHIPYPKADERQKVGCAFHHGKFVMALRQAAQKEKKSVYN
jgi:squalene monooxygenase